MSDIISRERISNSNIFEPDVAAWKRGLYDNYHLVRLSIDILKENVQLESVKSLMNLKI